LEFADCVLVVCIHVVCRKEDGETADHQCCILHARLTIQRAATSPHAERIYRQQLHTHCTGHQDQRDCTTL